MKEFELKYGCNPNQKPAKIFMHDGSELPIKILNGKPGYINFLDAFNSYQLVKELKAALGMPAATSFKHVSPTSAAIGLPLPEKLKKACFVDDVEDVRMAAEEGFVYSCATAPESCDVTFELSEAQVRASFSLGAEPVDPSDDALGLAELLLSAVCDEHGLSDDGSTLVLVKRAGQAYGE